MSDINISVLYDERIYESPTLMKDAYFDLIRECYWSQCGDSDKADKYTLRCIDWLESTDFFTAPASTKYHDSFQSGLLRHSLLVARNVAELMKLSQFHNIDTAEAILVALVHDWCKIDFYEEYQRNVKDDTTGQWYQQTAYRCKGSKIPLGHGVTSLYMAQKFFKINTEQALAIRWHMGDYTTSETEKYDLMEANKHPMVQLIQIADKLAATLPL